MRGRLGTLTIGQAPGTDIVSILDAVLPPDLPRRHAGIFDGLSRAAIAERFAPRRGAAPLITRLLDGTIVILDRDAIEAAAGAKLAMLEAEGCSIILMLCTGHFTTLACRGALLVEPDRVLPPTVAGLMGAGQLGIVVPLAEQVESEGAKWAPLKRPPTYAVASPYAATAAPDIAAASIDLARRGARAVLLDCMGFVKDHRVAARAAGLSVILSNGLIAKLVSEIV